MGLKTPQTIADRLDQKIFNAIYSRALVYNTCWEDPAVDRLALNLNADDNLLVITSAGCNVLDYALTGPQTIFSVDANPRQNALLELKLAGIRQLRFEDFFGIFGQGHHSDFREIYRRQLRRDLSPFAQAFWDKRADWFGNSHGNFYFHGLSGIVARAFRLYLRARPRLGSSVRQLFETRSLDDQRRVYERHVEPLMWTNSLKWVLSQQITMSMLGVPHPQRKQVIAQHSEGIAGFVRECIDYVFRQLPIWNNYFWTVYVNGRYTETCCPEYLKRDNFYALKNGLAERIQLHTCTVSEFLRDHEVGISKFVLLDHMDWMSSYYPEALAEEWRFILQRATTDARVIFRSAHKAPHYLEALELGGQYGQLHEHLSFHETLAHELKRFDRVHTYAGFHIADVRS